MMDTFARLKGLVAKIHHLLRLSSDSKCSRPQGRCAPSRLLLLASDEFLQQGYKYMGI